MKKVGIVTITELDNFGNRLQNYALQEVLKSKGFNVETIRNLICYGERKKILYKPLQLGKGIIRKNFRYRLAKVSKQFRFERFDKKYITFAKECSTINTIDDKLVGKYNYLIAGSDQIWNPLFCFNYEFNFLTFDLPEKRIAYSASFGVENVPDEKKGVFKTWLSEMKKISVREYQGERIVYELTGKHCDVMPDPTLLLSREEWNLIAKKPKWLEENKKFILKYFLGSDENYKEILEQLHKNVQYKEYEIIDINNPFDIKSYSITPDEFVYLINACELMITDSFHGTVFSIIMQTPFVHSLRKGESVEMNSRIDSLFKMLEIKNEEFICREHLNNTKRELIKKLRKDADEFLDNALDIERFL